MYYVRKYFPSADKLNTEQISEIDIYIPELKVGIEYDGPSHSRTVNTDIRKAIICKNMGIELIRIRDCKCPVIDDESYKIILTDDSFEALEGGNRIITLFKG